MARPGKITPEIERGILRESADGKSTREVAAWVARVHGVQLTHGAVAKLLRKTNSVRADVAAAVTREALRPHVTSDLDRLEEIRRELAEVRAKDRKLSHRDRVALARLELDVIVRRLELSGAAGAKADARTALAAEDVRRMAEEVLAFADAEE